MEGKKTLAISFVSSDTFREIFQTSAEGIVMVDKTGKILLANPVSEKMFGYASGTLVNHNLEDLLPDRYRSKHTDFRRQFSQHPEPRRMGVGRDLQAMRSDRSEFPVEISLSFTNIDDQFMVMAFITDITKRKAAEDALKKSEEQLIQYAAELEKKVQARTEALNQSIQKLEKVNIDLQQQIHVRQHAEEEARKALEKERELNELKSKFVSMASHEFRTPLSAILGSVSLIQQYRDRGDLTKVDKHVTRVKSSVSHLTAILNDFLSLGKLEEGRIEVSQESVSLSSFLREITEEVKPVLREMQQLIVTFAQPEKDFYTDPKVLRNILFNLISNAGKYSDPGKKIWVRVSYTEDQVTVAVQDEGIGIPQHELKNVFDRFFRASNAFNIQGTGLGLNIVKRYLDLLGGSIAFTSEESKGSTFTITIPSKIL